MRWRSPGRPSPNGRRERPSPRRKTCSPLWRLYDLIAWGGAQPFEAALPPNPARMFIGLVLCDEIIIFFHMLCVVTFQLGRLWFSRKKKGRVLQSQTAQQA